MGPLRLFGPLLFLFILSPLSECLKPSKCRTTEMSYDGGPLDIFMESNTDDNALCTYTVRYTQIEGHLDCGSYISISITGGAQTCEEGQVGEEKEFRCNCRWERCMDDVIEGLHADNGSAACLFNMKDAFDKERKQIEAADSYVHKYYYAEDYSPPSSGSSSVDSDPTTTGKAIGYGLAGGFVLILIITGFSIWGCVMCCRKRRNEETAVVAVGSPMVAMGPPPMACHTPMMAGPLAPLPVANVAAPPPGTAAYPHFNPNGPPPMGHPPPMANVGAPPPGNAAYPQFNPNQCPPPENFQGPVPVDQGGFATNNGDLRRKMSSKNSSKVGSKNGSQMTSNSKTPRQGMSKQGSNMSNQGPNMGNQGPNVNKQGSNMSNQGPNMNNQGSNQVKNGPPAQ